MTGFNHGLTGAIIALSIKQPALAVPLAFASHFAQDVIPHHDYFAGPKDEHLFSRNFNRMLVLDFSLSLGLLISLGLLFPAQRWLIWGCMVAAACPDMMQSYYHLYVGHIKKRQPKFDPLSRLHYGLQNEYRWGWIIELAWAAVGLLVISRFK